MMKKLLIGILVIISVLYLKFEVFNPYTWNGNLIMKDNVIYQINPKLFDKYSKGDIKSEKAIGIVKVESFMAHIFITRVIKLEGFNELETFLIKGLMFEEVYTKVDD